MRAHGKVAVEVNAEIADVGRWRYEVRPDPDRRRRELVKSPRRGTPEQFDMDINRSTVRPRLVVKSSTGINFKSASGWPLWMQKCSMESLLNEDNYFRFPHPASINGR
jgi:hypothetical protein